MQHKQVWQAALEDLQKRIDRTAFDTWLRSTALVGLDDDVATVAAPNTFSASTLNARYAADVERVLRGILGRPVQVQFTVLLAETDDDPAAIERSARMRQDAIDAANRARGGAARPAPRRPDPPAGAAGNGEGSRAASGATGTQLGLAPTTSLGLNERYVYATYVVGASNRFAHAASLAVAERPGGQYNPFFIHGGVGLGKTHLMHAIGHRALELHPGINVMYVSSEKFTNDLINAIRGQRMDDFRSRYRTIDILMIDDIQFIAGKDSTQEEFFHTFNTLYQSGKQVVLTSDRPPKAIAGLEDRLRSRFEGGLIADVQPPDFEMRTAILRTKAEELGVSLPADVIEYVAHKDQTNTRELEGALTRIIAWAHLNGRPISLQSAMDALTDSPGRSSRTSLTADAITQAVAESYGVPIDALRGRGRSRDVVTPRQVAMYLIREETGASLIDIGAAFDRDHTTVLHGIEKVANDLIRDTALRAKVMSIRETLYTGT